MIRILTVLLVMCVLASTVSANGYRILALRSAKATAMGEAFIVQADDPSAVSFNPAGLPSIDGTQASLQLSLCRAYTEHEDAFGRTTDNESEWDAVPGFYLASDLGTERFGAGLGLSFPNGLSTEWGEDSFARYVATYSSLTVADLSPAIGFRATERLKVGAGLNFYYSEARLENMMDMGLMLGMPGAADVRTVLEGEGTAWGFSAGAIYDFNSRHGVGLTWRKSYTIDYDGDVSIGDTKVDVEASIDFPEVIVLGYAYRPSEKLKIEFNLDWTHWSRVGDITMRSKTPGFADSAMPQKLDNTFAYKVGAEYLWSPSLALRCGYIYNENATAEETWRPSLPDTDMHFFLAGFGYTWRQVTLDVAGQLVWYETRRIDNNVGLNENTSSSSIDGTYRTYAPCLSVATTYRF